MSRRDYKRGPNRPAGGSLEVRWANDEVEAFYTIKRMERKAARERKEQRALEKRYSIALPKLKMSKATERNLAFSELAQTYGDFIDAWQSDDPRLAEHANDNV